jgi:hypothetical protein
VYSKNDRIIKKIVKNRQSCFKIIIEIWEYIETDLIYFLGIYNEFDARFELIGDFIDISFLSKNNDIIFEKQIEHQFQNKKEIDFEIDINYKLSDINFFETYICYDTNTISDRGEIISSKILLNLNYLGNIDGLTYFKIEFILSLINGTQEILNIKNKKIKDKNILLLDSILEEVVCLMIIDDIIFEDAMDKIFEFHKGFFDKMKYEIKEKIKLQIEELYNIIFLFDCKS